ncbi:TPA: hypothetical protein ACH3X1_006719 [Trebouxia sp. C0004]
MQRFLQFRLGCHSLPIAAGRFAGAAHVPRAHRSTKRRPTCSSFRSSSSEHTIFRGKLTVKADTMTDLPMLANQSEDPQLFTCPICLDECPRQELFVPSGCSHEFCRECARGIVLSAVRNLEFPIDCPVCKLNTPESDDEEEAPEVAQHQLQTLTPLDRTCSDIVSAQLGSDAVDPHYAMQLHASHSTPSLETAPKPHDSDHPPCNLGGGPSHLPESNDRSSQPAASRHDQEGTKANGFACDVAGLKSWLTPAFDLTARSGQHDSTHVGSMTQPHESDQAMSSQHGVSSPSFPIIASGTPITPSLNPTDGIVHQNSRLFSPHELSQSTATLSLSRAILGSHAGDADGDRSTDAQTAVTLPPDDLFQRSVSLGCVLTAPRGVTRGLSSPADWLTAAAAVSRSSSLASTSLSRGGSRRSPQGLHVRRGSLDADVHMLLSHEEEEEYLSKSLKAAAHRKGTPTLSALDAAMSGVGSAKETGTQAKGKILPFNSNCPLRCQDVTGEKCVSRYIPKKPKKKKGHRRGTKSCLSMGSMGDLIKGSLKKFGTMDLAADSDASLNRFLKRNRVLECPQCKNGITKMDGGCNHIMCAVCKTHICWLCGVKICQGINNYWDANRHFWIKGTPCYGQIQAVVK